ncbi:Fic family protein [Allokutzneria multivorans]|uniref:Fic family protein n=1 Tax=Allokutzneria multivorans TaxID=1142134 RepID=A0ABP7TG61_9PSEU
MKTPAPPPEFEKFLKKIQEEQPSRLIQIISSVPQSEMGAMAEYLPWDKFRYKFVPSAGMTIEELWFVAKFARIAMQRTLPLEDSAGKPFTYALPDVVFRAVEEVNRSASGSITLSEQVTNQATRDRYLVSSLMEEAITSSQLEGASTTRRVAKEMIRTGREPRDQHERMILNNYHAMRFVTELADEDLTPELICEIHRIVTDGTLESPAASGRFQLPGEGRVAVYDEEGKVLHVPPAAIDLPGRVARLCEFANSGSDDRQAYVPAVLRAITIHFMLGYDHPFEDGNGRTARALFYWSMLRQGFWLTEFLSISRILKGARGKYARSFLYTEQDDNDLTYFHIYHLEVIQRAVQELHQYLARKMEEVRSFQESLSLYPGEFNHRQLALLEGAVKNPSVHFTTISHSRSHGVTVETARRDLTALEQKGLLQRIRVSKALHWIPVRDVAEKLRSEAGDRG